MLKLIYVADFTEMYPYRLLKGIMSYMRGKSFSVCRVPHSFKRTEGLDTIVRLALETHSDAVIGQFEPTDDVGIFKRHGIVALAQDYKSRFEDIPNITGDYVWQGELAADYFVGKGFRHFAFYGYERVFWSEKRYEGFCRRLSHYGYGQEVFEFRKQPLENLWYYDSDQLGGWIRSLPKRTALFACDDTRANKVLEVCQLLQIHVPEDIAVLGVDNDDITCGLSYPQLSSINLDVYSAGVRTAKMIVGMLRDHDFKGHDELVKSTGIIDRQSTDIFATDDANILKVLMYIHQHISEPLDVESLLKLVPLSRRLLEINFRRETGQSIHRYIMEHRMHKLAQFLTTRSDTIADLGMEVGVNDPKNLSRQFKLIMGTSPAKYREQHILRL